MKYKVSILYKKILGYILIAIFLSLTIPEFCSILFTKIEIKKIEVLNKIFEGLNTFEKLDSFQILNNIHIVMEHIIRMFIIVLNFFLFFAGFYLIRNSKKNNINEIHEVQNIKMLGFFGAYIFKPKLFFNKYLKNTFPFWVFFLFFFVIINFKIFITNPYNYVISKNIKYLLPEKIIFYSLNYSFINCLKSFFLVYICLWILGKICKAKHLNKTSIIKICLTITLFWYLIEIMEMISSFLIFIPLGSIVFFALILFWSFYKVYFFYEGTKAICGFEKQRIKFISWGCRILKNSYKYFKVNCFLITIKL